MPPESEPTTAREPAATETQPPATPPPTETEPTGPKGEKWKKRLAEQNDRIIAILERAYPEKEESAPESTALVVEIPPTPAEKPTAKRSRKSVQARGFRRANKS